MTDTFKLVNGKPTIDKAPGASLDYALNFTKWLSSAGTPPDTIAAADVVAAIGVTVTDPPEVFDAARRVRVWVSGGTPNQAASVTVRVTTASTPPRIDTRTLHFTIKDR